VLDFRDNDCNGRADDRGLVRWSRYFRPWAAWDWEHRFATRRPAGFESDGHYVDLYPTNVCSGAFRPPDRCDPVGHLVWMQHGSLTGLVQCTGVLGVHHVSLALYENSGEHLDQRRVLDCRRIGYVYNGGSWRNIVGGIATFYRHRSGFDANGKGDNMWSTDPNEGRPLYNNLGGVPAWRAKGGQ